MKPRLQAVLVTWCALLTLVGCGGSDSEPAHSVRVPPNLVTQRDIDRYPPGTPKRATLEWFQAAQFADVTSLRQLSTARAVRPMNDKQLSYVLRLTGAALARPKFEETRGSRDRVSLRMLLISYDAKTGRVVLREPATLPLVRTRRGWKIDDVSLLKEAADQITQQRK